MGGTAGRIALRPGVCNVAIRNKRPCLKTKAKVECKNQLANVVFWLPHAVVHVYWSSHTYDAHTQNFKKITC